MLKIYQPIFILDLFSLDKKTSKCNDECMNKPIIIVGSDHGGFEQKKVIKDWLQTQDYQVEDVGAYQLDPTDDYPKFAIAVANKVVDLENQVTQPDAVGILFCRSAGGVTIAANKVKGARAVAIFDEKSAIHAKEHNNANIISIAGDWTSADKTKEIIKAFLSASYNKEERHQRRLAQIKEFEAQNN